MNKNYLIPGSGNSDQILQYCDDMFANEHVVYGCATTLILQPQFSNELLQTLPEDLAVAADHASQYKSLEGSSLSNTFFQNVYALSDEIVNLLEGARPTIESLDKGSMAFDDFREIIGLISDMSTQVDSDVNSSFLVPINASHEKYVDLLKSIWDDDTRFRTAIKNVLESNEVQKRENQFKDIQSKLADLNLEVAKGATSHLGDSVLFGLNIGTELMGGAIEPTMIAGVILEIVGEGGAISEFNEQMEEQHRMQMDLCEQIRTISTQIATSKRDVLTLSLSAAQLNEFYIRAQNSLEIEDSFITLMQDWRTTLHRFMNIETAPQTNFYTIQLNAGIEYWSGLSAKASQCLRRLRMTEAV